MDNPSPYDLHIKNFNSCELKFLIEYQYDTIRLMMCNKPRNPKIPGLVFYAQWELRAAADLWPRKPQSGLFSRHYFTVFSRHF